MTKKAVKKSKTMVKPKPTKRKKVLDEFLDDSETYDEELIEEEDIPDEEEMDDEEDGCMVIDFRPVPETGKALQFFHAGGKVRGTVLHINPDGTFKAIGTNGIKYPTVHKEDIMQEGHTPIDHMNSRVRKLTNVSNGRVTSKTSSRSPRSSGGGEPAKGSIIYQILELYKSGLDKAAIIAKGFNKSTVSRQVGEFIKRQQKQ
jgi:hypothetical protein